eukprot:m.15247 g.15247  ORF g.15247 m.15247 type:complete len:307 (+) comp3010_c0_seq2:231-1151(+)
MSDDDLWVVLQEDDIVAAAAVPAATTGPAAAARKPASSETFFSKLFNKKPPAPAPQGLPGNTIAPKKTEMPKAPGSPAQGRALRFDEGQTEGIARSWRADFALARGDTARKYQDTAGQLATRLEKLLNMYEATPRAKLLLSRKQLEQAIVPWAPTTTYCRCLAPHSRSSTHCRLCGDYCCSACITSVASAELAHRPASLMDIEMPICKRRCLAIARPPVISDRARGSHDAVTRLHQALSRAWADAIRARDPLDARGGVLALRRFEENLAQARTAPLEGADMRVCAALCARFQALIAARRAAMEGVT